MLSKRLKGFLRRKIIVEIIPAHKTFFLQVLKVFHVHYRNRGVDAVYVLKLLLRFIFIQTFIYAVSLPDFVKCLFRRVV